MLSKFQSMWDVHLARINVAKNRIKLLHYNSQRLHSVPYRTDSKARAFEKIEIDKKTKQKVIEQAKTKWAVRKVFLRKKDETLGFCVNYRRRNDLEKTRFAPHTASDEFIDSLSDAAIFSTFNAKRGYWQVEIDKKHCGKTAFTSQYGLCQFTRMPYRFRNALVTFQ